MKISSYIFIFLILSQFAFAENSTFTQADREMLIRLSEKVELMDKKFELIDKRFEQIDKRFEQIDGRFQQVEDRFQHIEGRMDSHFIALITLFVGLFTAMIGFIFWDRRMALVPVNAKVKELEDTLQKTNEENSKLKKALKDFAEKNLDFKDALGRAAIF